MMHLNSKLTSLLLTSLFVMALPHTAMAQTQVKTQNQIQEQEPQEGQPQYWTLVSDVPIKQGLVHLEDMDVVFDKPNGRIAESVFYAENLTADDINNFYIQALPQLGWSIDELGNYVRDQEQLVIKTQQTGGELTVRFLLSPSIHNK